MMNTPTRQQQIQIAEELAAAHGRIAETNRARGLNDRAAFHDECGEFHAQAAKELRDKQQ